MTNKLYYQDPYLREFEAIVLETGVDGKGVPYAVLDHTAFYPTGGGQPYDTGTIAGIPVINVEDTDGKVVHQLAAPLPSDAVRVQCAIDWQRRFDHMQQHSGQHLLSAAFETLYDAETFGFHMGQEVVTVDIARHPILPEEIRKVEEQVNRIIFDNRPISAKFVTAQELASIPLRKPPSVTENIRIVTVADFDYSPCGGTHPAQTGEIGLVKVLRWEKYKSGTRVEFVCGWRAIGAFDQKQQILRELNRLLGTGDSDLVQSLTKLQQDRKELERNLQESQQALAEHEAARLRNESDSVGDLRVSMAVYTNRSMQDLQRLAGLVTANEMNRVILLADGGEKINLVFAKTQDVRLSMVELLKSVLPLIDGKGGGNASIAQGGGNGNGDPNTLLQETIRRIKQPHHPIPWLVEP